MNAEMNVDVNSKMNAELNAKMNAKMLYLVRNLSPDAEKSMRESPIVGGWRYVVEL